MPQSLIQELFETAASLDVDADQYPGMGEPLRKDASLMRRAALALQTYARETTKDKEALCSHEDE